MQMKDTPARRKSSRGSKAASKKTDELHKYRQQAAPIINALFDDDTTPPFIRDLLDEMLTELESATQVFWNHREIAVVALPLMLSEAHRQGIDFFSERSEIFDNAVINLHQRTQSKMDAPTRSESDQLFIELEADAAAVSRILNSPRVPDVIKNDLADRVCELVQHPISDPAVMRVAYPLAVLDLMNKEKAKAEGSAGGE